ncbi:transporter substrate-binding domain-containing protein [Paradesulfitobacterium aromaticivorans]
MLTIYLLFLTALFSCGIAPTLTPTAGAEKLNLNTKSVQKTIRVGGDNNYPPYEFLDVNGIYKGFNVDVMRAIGIELGLDIEITSMSWNDTQAALQQGKIDLIQGMTYSKTRSATYDFSDPLVTNTQAIFVRSDNRYINDLGDLKAQTVAVQRGDISTEMLSQIPGVHLVERTNQEEGLSDLLAGKVDAFVGNRLTGLYFSQKEHKTEELKIVGEPLNPTDYAVAVLKGNKQLLDLINQGIAAIKKDGTYNKIYHKWFGEEIIDESRLLQQRLTIALLVVGLALVIILIIFYWNRALHQKVAEHTLSLRKVNRELLSQKEEVEKSNRLKEKILESSLNGIIACDAYGVILSYNSMTQKILGLDKGYLGQPLQDSDIASYFDSEHVRRALEDKQITRVKEAAFRTPEGEERILAYSLSPILNAESEVEGIVIGFSDITEEKHLQEKLYLQDRIQSLGQIVAGVAHELRNPLTSIQAFVELIPQKLGNPDFREQIVRFVPQEIRRLSQLIDNLLNYTRPQQLQHQSVPVKDITSSILALVENEARGKQVRVEVEVPPLLNVMVNPQQLQQVFMNLFLNSLQSLPTGGKIAVRAWAEDEDKVSIEVSDNGKGISEKDLLKVFEPFFSLHKGGTGLGLFIVYKLTKENNGEITIQSAEGKGTTVTMLFSRG